MFENAVTANLKKKSPFLMTICLSNSWFFNSSFFMMENKKKDVDECWNDQECYSLHTLLSGGFHIYNNC